MAGELRAWPEPAALPALLWWRSANVGAQEVLSSGTAVHSQPTSPRHGNMKCTQMGWERLCNLISVSPGTRGLARTPHTRKGAAVNKESTRLSEQLQTP